MQASQTELRNIAADNLLLHCAGIKAGTEVLFVNEAGKWLGKYVPAFLRRYPFVFSSNDEGKNFTLCIDGKFLS